jgi:hypothetical protein
MFAYITLLVGIIQAICLLQQLHYVVVFSTHRACARIAARRRFPLPDRMKPDIDMPILIVPSEEQLFSLLSGLPRCSSPFGVELYLLIRIICKAQDFIYLGVHVHGRTCHRNWPQKINPLLKRYFPAMFCVDFRKQPAHILRLHHVSIRCLPLLFVHTGSENSTTYVHTQPLKFCLSSENSVLDASGACLKGEQDSERRGTGWGNDVDVLDAFRPARDLTVLEPRSLRLCGVQANAHVSLSQSCARKHTLLLSHLSLLR